MVTFGRMDPVDVAIVGGGASGTLVAMQLLQRARGPFRIALIERAGTVGRGIAYASPQPYHLLNVPAAGMSAFPDLPDDFVRWSGASPDQFVSRAIYGDYLAAILAEARGKADAGVSLAVFAGEVTGLSPADLGVRVVFSDGVELAARAAVLALGNFPGAELVSDGGAAVRESPWEPGALDGLASDSPVLLLGTGLTMVDAALALDDRGHRGPMYALSRRGLLPHVYGETAIGQQVRVGASGLRSLLRALRVAARAATDWRGIVDALRPVTPRIWTRLSVADKRRFLRHLRPYWDVHRHRMAPSVAEKIAQLKAEGRLRIQAGRLRSIEVHGEEAVARYRPRGERRDSELRVARIVNCTGPAMYLADMRHPLLASALEHGLVQSDALGVGLETDADGALRGTGAGRLFTLGNLRRGELWETTAIPELRDQASTIAERLVRELSLPYTAEATV